MACPPVYPCTFSSGNSWTIEWQIPIDCHMVHDSISVFLQGGVGAKTSLQILRL